MFRDLVRPACTSYHSGAYGWQQTRFSLCEPISGSRSNWIVLKWQRVQRAWATQTDKKWGDLNIRGWEFNWWQQHQSWDARDAAPWTQELRMEDGGQRMWPVSEMAAPRAEMQEMLSGKPPWIMDCPLKTAYPNIYRICNNQQIIPEAGRTTGI